MCEPRCATSPITTDFKLLQSEARSIIKKAKEDFQNTEFNKLNLILSERLQKVTEEAARAKDLEARLKEVTGELKSLQATNTQLRQDFTEKVDTFQGRIVQLEAALKDQQQ